MKNWLSAALVGTIGVLLLSGAAHAAKAKKHEPLLIPPPEAEIAAFPWLTDEQYAAEKKTALDRSNRKLASSPELNDSLLSDAFKQFRTRFLASKTPEELDAILVDADQKYESFPEDLKFAAAQLVPLRSFRSLVYRFRPFVSHTKVTHSLLLSIVRTIAAATRTYLPTDQWTAGMRYLTEPFDLGTKQFDTEDDIQAFLGNELYPKLLNAVKRLRALKLDHTVAWDNQILYGTASYQDQLDRYRLIGDAERNTAVSALHAGMSFLSGALAYHWSDILTVSQEVGYLYGFDGFLKGVNGASARDRAAVAMKHPMFLTLKTEQQIGSKWMAASYKHLYESARFGMIAWNELKDRPANPQLALDPGLFTPVARQGNLTLATIEEMVARRTAIRSAVTGETVTVDIPQFFQYPPIDLKTLLPTQFEGGAKELQKTIGGRTVKFRNYLEGRATDWNVEAYRRYFPSLQNGSSVMTAARILSQAWGGFPLSGPLAFLVL